MMFHEKPSLLTPVVGDYITDINFNIAKWLEESELSERDTRIAIANALIQQCAHWFARNLDAKKDEFLDVAGNFYDANCREKSQ